LNVNVEEGAPLLAAFSQVAGRRPGIFLTRMFLLAALAGILRATTTTIPSLPLESQHGSAGGPVTIAVFKTVDRRLSAAMVGSTPTRFRHFSTT